MTSQIRALQHPDIGTELVREWEPEGTPKGTFVIVHGLAEHSGRYTHVGDQMAEAGYRVRAFDLIGAGGSGGKRWDIDDWTRFHDQVDTHVSWARERGEETVILLGHSLGGNLALGATLRGAELPDKLVLSAPALAGGAGWQRALAPFMASILPKMVLPNGVKADQLSRDPAVGDRYFADPLVVTKSSIRLGAGLFAAMDSLNEKLDRLNLPTLVLHGGEDQIVPTKSSESLAGLDNVDRMVYPGLRHELLNEPEHAELVDEIIAWVGS